MASFPLSSLFLPFLPLLLTLVLLTATCIRRRRKRHASPSTQKTDSSLPDRRTKSKKLFRPSHAMNKLGWTVHKRRQAEIKKAKRRENVRDIDTVHSGYRTQRSTVRSRKTSRDNRQIGHLQPYAVLRLLFISNLSENKREALAALLPMYCGQYKWYEKKCFRVCNMIWALLQKEKNAQIRKPLLVLGQGLKCGIEYFDNTMWFGREHFSKQCLMGIIEEGRCDEREIASHLLGVIFEECDNCSDEDADFIRTWWRRLTEQHNKPYPVSDRLMASAIRCLHFTMENSSLGNRDWTPEVRAIAEESETMSFMFDSLTRDSTPLREEPSDSSSLRSQISIFICSLLGTLPADDRSSFIARHDEELRQLLILTHPWHLPRIARYDQIQDMIATTPAALANVWQGGGNHRCKGSYSRQMPLASMHERCCWNDVANVILRSLAHALNDPPRLQAMLGDGLIVIAHHFASDERDTSPHAASVFRHILDRHPEFVPRFVAVAKFGCATNRTAELARSLSQRPFKAGEWYIFDEDSDDDNEHREI